MEHFPQQEPVDRKAGDEVLADLDALLRSRVDPTEVDLTGRLPEGLLDELRTRGFMCLQAPRELGGHGLSCYNTYRVVRLAASWSVPVALVIAIQNAVGVGALLPALPPGPLSDLVRAQVAGGVLSGSADTEPEGAANARRNTSARPTDDGTAYLISGEKIHIGNGPIAEMITISAAVRGEPGEPARLFFTPTGGPGFEVRSEHEFMGVKGFPNAALTFTDLRVPREHMFVEQRQDSTVRITGELTKLVSRGRLYLIVAPSAAIAKLCLEWSRDFISRRKIDGRELGEYDEIQRMMADSLAEVFAIDAISEWSLLCEDQPREINVRFEQNVAKNIGSVTCWRIIDRTMSLLAGEGYETARSKERRGARPLPLERFFRDARNFRISGGIDFQIDNWTAQLAIFSYYYPEPYAEEPADGPDPECADLNARNQDHLRFAARETRRFGRVCRRLAAARPAAELFQREHLMIALNQIVDEVLTMSLTLARAARWSRDGHEDGQALADIFCTRARHRLAALWHEVEAQDGPEPDYSQVSTAWLSHTPAHGHNADTLTPADADADDHGHDGGGHGGGGRHGNGPGHAGDRDYADDNRHGASDAPAPASVHADTSGPAYASSHRDGHGGGRCFDGLLDGIITDVPPAAGRTAEAGTAGRGTVGREIAARTSGGGAPAVRGEGGVPDG
ncbi:acyl-CoA dehydrogenase family protein [Spongiactinospora sp. 9N601]|uniref:acyl-CoA dehydrogenase family protein n=1 Tax=Spongiactinospora sp. 9N601 TaxID=3375149 RepID=UPI0037CB490A